MSHYCTHYHRPEPSSVPCSPQARDLTLHILDELAGGNPPQTVSIRLWDGTTWPATPAPGTVLVLNRPSALREMLLPGSEAALGEAHLDRAYDIEGNVEAAFALADLFTMDGQGWRRRLGLACLLRRLPEPPQPKAAPARKRVSGVRHSLHRDREAIGFHYDVSNDFYSLWLDPQMVYSCAYFAHPEDDLEAAQRNKLDHICRKLELKGAQRLLDIGCGWGGLILHAAKHYGVRAKGITLSARQAEWVRKRIVEEGVEDYVTVEVRDYRELDEVEGFDAVASVGMVEHIGRQNLGLYFRQAARLLKPGGLFLNHGIGEGIVPRRTSGESFIDKHVFPDGDLVPLPAMLGAAEAESLEIRDVENLREHYTRTLREWVRRLESRREEVLHHVREPIYRTWRLYMAGSAYAFQKGHLAVYQTLLTKLDGGGHTAAPPTRAGWYRTSPQEATPA